MHEADINFVLAFLLRKRPTISWINFCKLCKLVRQCHLSNYMANLSCQRCFGSSFTSLTIRLCEGCCHVQSPEWPENIARNFRVWPQTYRNCCSDFLLVGTVSRCRVWMLTWSWYVIWWAEIVSCYGNTEQKDECLSVLQKMGFTQVAFSFWLLESSFLIQNLVMTY